MKENAIYVKADRNIKVEKKTIYISDVAKVYCKDKQIAEKIKQLILYKVKNDKTGNYVFTILKIIEIIQKEFPDYLICNMGETDFIVEYNPKKKEKKMLNWVKVAFVSIVTFFGAAFTIMTFNEDASVEQVFDKIYQYVLGEKNTESYLLEISYAIGIPIGTIVFFNHFSKVHVSNDPTPLQIQLRVNEQEINQTIIENAEREGQTIDVD